MKLLTFLARRFAWTAHVELDARATEAASQVRPVSDEASGAPSGAMDECVVVFVHAEPHDELAAGRAALLRQAQKHVEWLARKRATKRCVLHSFTHLAQRGAGREFARAWIDELAQRLQARGFEVGRTPFGWSCAWELAVHGESVAKVWKSLGDLPEGDAADES